MTAMIRMKDQSQDKADAPSRLAAVRQAFTQAFERARLNAAASHGCYDPKEDEA